MLVTADRVTNGKPDPEGYRAGRARAGRRPGAIAVVFEDAPAGIAAGKAAGARVIGITTTHAARGAARRGRRRRRAASVADALERLALYSPSSGRYVVRYCLRASSTLVT